MCVVSDQCTDINDTETLRQAASKGKVQFVFGDPMSASGTILPMHVLRSQGIDFAQHMEYSFGHQDSVDLIRDHHRITVPGSDANSPKNTLQRVGFVFDPIMLKSNPVSKQPNSIGLKKIPLKLAGDDLRGGSQTMDDVRLPIEVWVARKDFDDRHEGETDAAAQKRSETLRRALVTLSSEAKGFEESTAAQLETKFRPIHEWAKEIKCALSDDTNVNAASIPGVKFPVRFQDILSLVQHYNRVYLKKKKQARLARSFPGAERSAPTKRARSGKSKKY